MNCYFGDPGIHNCKFFAKVHPTMASGSVIEPDLSLPSHASTEQYRHSHNYDGDRIAVYTLAALGNGGGPALITALEASDQCLHDTCQLAPGFDDFVDCPLRTVYEHHLAHVASSHSYYPTLFIVAHRPDYQTNGVLLVNLDVDCDGRVDFVHLPIDEAAGAFANLSIANMDWEDYKDDNNGGDPPGDDNNGGDPPGDAGRLFAVYTTDRANMTNIVDDLEPGWYTRPDTANRCEGVCTYQAPPDPWQQMVNMHPWCCYRAEGAYHPQLYICADHKDYQRNGVLLVKQEWDGNINRTPRELCRLGKTTPVHTQRRPVATAVAAITAIADGTQPWTTGD